MRRLYRRIRPDITGRALHAAWHGCYCRWYDHREAGHRGRAAVWGWLADRLVGAVLTVLDGEW